MLSRRPSTLIRAAVVVAGIGLATTGLTTTRAAFTDSETVSFVVSTGSVAITRDGDGLEFSSAPLAPGDSATGDVRVTNAGTEAISLSLSREMLESTPGPGGCSIRDALRLRIVEDVDGDPSTTSDRTEVLNEMLAAAAATSALGRVADGEARSYEFTLTFEPQSGATSDDNDNCFQGSLDRERFSWSAAEAQ